MQAVRANYANSSSSSRAQAGPPSPRATSSGSKKNLSASGSRHAVDGSTVSSPPIGDDFAGVTVAATPVSDADLRALTSPDPHVRQACCQALGRPNLRGDARVVSALVGRLQDRDQYVRQAAAAALGQVSRRGDEANIAALAARLTDSDSAVRRLSTVALGQVAQRGCQAAISAALTRVDDRDGGVRRAALKTLEKLGEKNDPLVLSGVFARSGDSEAFVRHAAVEALSRLAETGDSEVVSRLLVLLDSDRDSRVRWACTEALGRLAVRGDSRVLTALLQRLEDEADCVRRAAATALGHVTFAPLQELELQERHIAEIEFRGAHEVAARDKALVEAEERHSAEVKALQRRVDELEERLQKEVGRRDHHIAALEHKLVDQGYLSRVGEFIPHASQVTQFLDTLPALAGPDSYGTEIVAPVWALRCMRGCGPEPTARGNAAMAQTNAKRGSMCSAIAWGGEDGSATEGKERRWLMTLFDMFEQLSSGVVTSLELTDKTPLDVYVHRGDDDAWGLYCCSRHRMMALLMRQACCRSEMLQVKCVLRPKDDTSFWAWQWGAFYDGTDGLTANTSNSRYGSFAGRESAGGVVSPTASRMSLHDRSSILSGPSNRRGSSARTSLQANGRGSTARRSGLVAGNGVEQATEEPSSPITNGTRASLVSSGGVSRGPGRNTSLPASTGRRATAAMQAARQQQINNQTPRTADVAIADGTAASDSPRSPASSAPLESARQVPTVTMELCSSKVEPTKPSR